METQSLKFVQELIQKDLVLLDNSGLKSVNLDKYEEFKNSYFDLNKKVMNYQSGVDLVGLNIVADTVLNLKWVYARISASFDFYMSIYGTQEVLSYQITKVKTIFSDLFKRLTYENYHEVKEELEHSLNLYQDILKHTLNDFEVQEWIQRIKYRIYQFMLEDYLEYDLGDKRVFIPLVLEDISSVLEDSEVDEKIKNKLEKYSFDSGIISDHFNSVIMLIILAKKHKQYLDTELEEILNRKIYKECDLQLSYHEPSQEIKQFVEPFLDDSYEVIKFLIHQDKYDVKEVVSYWVVSNHFIFSYREIARILVKYHFSDIKYLLEAWVCNICELLSVSSLFSFVEACKEHGKNCDDDLESVLMIYCQKFLQDDPDSLIDYAFKFDNFYLKKYILNSSDLYSLCRYYDKEPTLEVRQKIVNQLNSFESIREVTLSMIDSDFIVSILNCLKRGNKSDVLSWLLSLDANTINYVVDNMLQDQEFDNFLKYAYDYFSHTYLRLSRINWRVLDVFGACSLSNHSEQLEKLNAKTLKLFIKKFAKYRLNWANIFNLECVKHQDNLRKEILFDFCLENPVQFIEYFQNGRNNNFLLTSNFYMEVIQRKPELICFFLTNLLISDVLKLPKETLDVFAKYYEDTLKQEGVLLEEKIDCVLEKKGSFDGDEAIKLIIYLMYTGLMTDQLISYFYNFANIFSYHILFLEAIKNTKDFYKRVSYFQSLNEFADIPYSQFSFLTSREIQILRDEGEIGELKLRKYYGDLLKLMVVEDVSLRSRITVEIARSGVLEYIIFLKENYPEYVDILKGNIMDADIYQKIIDFNYPVEIEDALKIKLLLEKS